MSWPPSENSSNRIRMSGLPTFMPSSSNQRSQQQQQQHTTASTGEKLRLPPLSTLISGSFSNTAPSSSSSTTPTSLHSPSTSTSRPDWSPLSNHANPIPTVSRTSPIPDRLQQHHRFQTGEAPPPLGALYPIRHQQQQHHQAEPQIRRTLSANISLASPSSSSSSSSLAPVNLPPLTSLSIHHHSTSRSPSSTSSLYNNDALPPRLPSTSSSSNTYSEPRRSRIPESPSSSSSVSAGLGPTRRRWTGGSSSSRPYDRPASPSSDQEYFSHVWEIYSYSCRVNDEAIGSVRRSYPSIAEGDVKTLIHYLHRELDQLEGVNARLSRQLAQEVGLFNKRYGTSSRKYDPGHTFTSKSDEEMDMASVSSPSGSHHSPTHTYHSGLPATVPPPRHHQQQQHRRESIGSSSAYSFNRSPILSHPMTTSHQSYHQRTMMTSTPSSSSSATPTPLPPKRVRKRKDEADQSCLSCSATETPEWRKGPTGPRTLCNACGLLFAKQCRKREMDAQAKGERPRGSRPLAPEALSPEEKERSLIELKIAVNARSNVSPI